MARLGYLMLRQGNWNGRQVVPADWVGESTRAFEGAYEAHGAFGQYIIVMPKLDLVVAHKTRPDLRDAQGNPRGVWASDLVQILDVLVRTHCGASCR